MKRTLGGDRLGVGKKMEVDMRSYSKSNHDLGYIWRSTMSAGTLVPFLCKVANRGDSFDIDLEAMAKTLPTVGPLFGSAKVQLDIFLCPWRLYQGQLHNNALGIGLKMQDIKLPILRLDAKPVELPANDLDNSQINPSCILSYLGLRGVGLNYTDEANLTRDFNGISYLAYWDIYKNYYANKQEELGAVINTPVVAVVETIDSIAVGGVLPQDAANGTWQQADQPTTSIFIEYTGATPNLNQVLLVDENGNKYTVNDLFTGFQYTAGVPNTIEGQYKFSQWGTKILFYWKYISDGDLVNAPIQISTFPLENLDTMRNKILAATEATTPFNIRGLNLPPYSYVLGTNLVKSNMMGSQEGLALKTYMSDIFNNWLKTEWIDGTDGINDITAIDTSGGSFTLDTLNLSKKVYDMLNRIAVSGGSYYDYLDATYTEMESRPVETPMYMGGLVRELVFSEVVATAASEGTDGAQPLGNLAGKGIMADKKKGGKVIINVTEPSYIIGIVSVTPRLDYSQGNAWDLHLQNINDLHKPALDEIGFQDLVTERMAWWDTAYVPANAKFVTKAAGKQPAWVEYMTSVNETRGNFAIKSQEMFMTINRRYEYSPTAPESGILDLTTYVDPRKFNYIFAQASLDSQNIWMQIAVDINARRIMSGKLMPNI